MPTGHAPTRRYGYSRLGWLTAGVDSAEVRAAIRFKRHSKVQFDTLGFRVARTMGP